jgi:3-oxoacyl-[acyl-carrier protein] reductase
MTKDWQLSGRRAVVTGCENVLGRAIARGLSSEGVAVIQVANREIDGCLRVDYAKEGAAAIVKEKVGQTDILVNATSGLHAAISTPADISVQDWQDEMREEFMFPRELAHAFLPDMMANRWGRIVNLVGSSEPLDFGVEYAASGALQGWAKGLCRQVGRHGITINCVQPGLINGTEAAKRYKHSDTLRTEEQVIPFGCPGEPEDVANAVAYLCTPFADHVSGIVLPVDGGMSRHQH